MTSKVSYIALFAYIGGLFWALQSAWKSHHTPRLPDVQIHYLPEPLPDFSQYSEVEDKKRHFSRFMLPQIQKANSRVIRIRHAALRLLSQPEPLNKIELSWLAQLCETYHFSATCQRSDELLKEVKLRIDAVPIALAMAQSANESGWGTSRFAQEANNMYGQWCFKKGCGLVPLQREEGAIHEVAAFKSPLHSIASYIRNVNSHRAYRRLRSIRAATGGDAIKMAEGLISYSERGRDYVNEIASMIHHNPEWSRGIKLSSQGVKAESVTSAM